MGCRAWPGISAAVSGAGVGQPEIYGQSLQESPRRRGKAQTLQPGAQLLILALLCISCVTLHVFLNLSVLLLLTCLGKNVVIVAATL